MRYLGSKAGVLPQLEELVPAAKSGATFADPFGGIGVVGAHFRSLGYTVHSGDILSCANAFQTAKLAFKEAPLPAKIVDHLGLSTADEFIDYLNGLRPVYGWVVREFSDQRQYFMRANAAKIDAVRRELWRLNRAGILEGDQLKYYLACLISSADYVANTAGTYYAHLKTWDRKAKRTFSISPLEVPRGPLGTAHQVDATQLVKAKTYDVLYLDPPYNSRDYAGYYHLPETFATGRRPRPRGRSGVHQGTRPVSTFVRTSTATTSVEELVRFAKFKQLIFHYADNGLVQRHKIRLALSEHGDVSEHVLSTSGYSNSGSRETTHRIYVVER